jgi:DNA repair protein RadD
MNSNIKLRGYQEEMIQALRETIRSGKQYILLQSPTGSGKTRILAHMVALAALRGKRPMFTVPAREILIQTTRSLQAQNITFGIIAAGFTSEPEQLIQVATIQTLARRINSIQPPDFVVIDECHHAPASQWRKLWDVWPDTVFIGLTATPWRLDGKGLGDQFETMVMGPTVRELIDQGYLSDYVVYAPPVGIDTSGIKTRAGDFAKDQLADAVDKPTITGNAVAHYKKIANGKRAVVAAVSIEHSKHITAEFNAAGVYAVHLDGCEDQNRRDHIMNDFAAGRIQVLSQVGIINEGVDIPGIEAVISLRPTKSLSLWLQFIGRALRPAPGKDRAIILDHAGNTHLHGLPCDEREWSLEGAAKRSSGKKNTPNIQVKQCPGCYACHAPADRCPSCGHIYHKQEREVDQVEGELQAVDPKVMRLQRQQEVKQAQTLEDLQELGRQRGYKPGWAYHIWKARLHRQGVAA